MRKYSRGYTLIELMVALGVFAIVAMLASGAYLVMVSITRQAQGVTTGINNLSFALETMTRDIRTGVAYSCGGGDCPAGSGTFTIQKPPGVTIDYSLAGGRIVETRGGQARALTDASVNVSSLRFYVVGTSKPPADYFQPHVLMVVSGSVSSGPGKTENFTVQTGATMRGTDI